MESNGPFRACFEGAEHQLGYLVNGLWVYVLAMCPSLTKPQFTNLLMATPHQILVRL